MPNLITNTVSVQFPCASSRQAFAAITSQTINLPETAILKALKVLLLGLSGHLQPTAALPVLPVLQVNGGNYAPKGINPAGNDAYSSLLDLIANDVRLTADVLDLIDCIYAQSGAETLQYAELTDEAKFMFILLARKAGQFLNHVVKNESEHPGEAFFNALGRQVPRPAAQFDLDDFLCRPLVGALSGFSGFLFDGRDGYSDNVATYGTKFNVCLPLAECALEQSELVMLLRFDSADSPAVEAIAAMFELFGATGSHLVEDHEEHSVGCYTYLAGELDGAEEADFDDGGSELKRGFLLEAGSFYGRACA